ncbi:MAG TPA: energy transducer TonB [Bryobacteraceae bacterium]|jgi:TonB family protein|nr:energy transducer TonB [Bryobacteraceae bacterium]
MILALACKADLAADDSKQSSKDPDEKVYDPGGDVKPPKLVHYVEPQFSSSAKEAFIEGTVKISTVVTTDGIATQFHIVSGLNSEEDRTALDALKQWKFQPGTKAGKPVKVKVTVEVDFHLL